jgi:hypothetical protein
LRPENSSSAVSESEARGFGWATLLGNVEKGSGAALPPPQRGKHLTVAELPPSFMVRLSLTMNYPKSLLQDSAWRFPANPGG